MLTSTLSRSTTHFLERPDGRIAYEDSGGSGPLVVAVPGLGDLRQEYRFLAPKLAEAGYRVVSMDLRGLGESSVGWPDYSAEAMGGDILALLQELAAGPAVLIGTSMGAAAVAWAAVERPDLVAGLVLIGPFVRGDVRVSLVQRLMLKTLMRRPWGPAAWSRYYRSLYPSQPPADLDAYRAALTANLREAGRFEATQGMMWASKAGVDRRLGEVRTPTLVVMGTRDPDFPDPVAEAKLVAERLRGDVALIDGAGHYPHAELPEQTSARVLEFLADLGARHGR